MVFSRIKRGLTRAARQAKSSVRKAVKKAAPIVRKAARRSTAGYAVRAVRKAAPKVRKTARKFKRKTTRARRTARKVVKTAAITSPTTAASRVIGRATRDKVYSILPIGTAAPKPKTYGTELPERLQIIRENLERRAEQREVTGLPMEIEETEVEDYGDGLLSDNKGLLLAGALVIGLMLFT